jgi:hypothetical protein
MNRRWPIAGLMLLACSAAASAASFEVVSGEGSMNRGQGFRRVTGKVDAPTGTTLHVPAGSQAFLVYENGCRVRVTPGAFVRVQRDAPCDAIGRDVPVAVDPDTINPLTLGLVTLVGVGGLAWGISEANKGNKLPLSP